MRTVNFRLLGFMMLSVGLTAGVAFAIHEAQVRRHADVLLREAKIAKERKDWNQAIDYLDRYVTLVPNSSGPLADLALLQADLGLFGQAFRNAESVLRQDPQRNDVRRRLIDVALAIGRYSDARHHIEVLRTNSPDDGDLLILLARCQIAMGEYPAAAETLKQVIEGEPSRLEAYSRLAALLNDHLKNPGGALSKLDEMVEKNTMDSGSFVIRGSFRLDHPNARPVSAPLDENQAQADPSKTPPAQETDALDAAVADARRALEIAPDEEAVILFAVRCFVADAKLDEAQELARRGLTLFPKNSSMFMSLANVEANAGHRDEAISWLERGVAATSENSDLLWNLANLLVDAGRVADAQKTLERLRSTKYPKPPLNYLELRILVEQGQWIEASKRLEDLRPALTAWPDLMKGAYFWLGRCYAALGQTDRQLIAFRGAVGIDSRWLPVRLGIASALLSTGRIDEALDEYRQIVDRMKKPPLAVLEQLARLEIMVNLRRNVAARNWASAEQILDKIEEEDPDSASAPILRAEILVAQGKDEEAEKRLQVARDRSPQTVEFWLGLVALAERHEAWDQAWELFDEAQAAVGDSVQIRLARGRHLVNRDKVAAKEPIRELAKTDEAFTADERMALYSGLAILSLSIADFEETERLCQLVAQEQPLNLRVRLLLFDLAFRADKPLVMAQVLDEVQRIERSGPLWHYGEAVRLSVLAKKEQQPQLYSDARKHLVDARVARPAWSRIPLLLAQINESEGDEESAISNYTEAMKLGELSPGIISHAVGLLYQRSRFLEADLLIRRLQEQQSPFSNEMTRLAAEVSLRLNDTVRGLDLVTKAAKTSTDPDDHVWAGRIYSALGQSEQAEAGFRQAIEMDATLVEGWVGLIQHFGRTQQMPKAEAALIEAREKISPAEAPLALARALESIGKIDEAEANYKAALAAAPDEVAMIRRLADFYLRHGKEPEAKPLLSRLVDGLKGVSDGDRMWGRRSLALSLIARGADAAATKQALALVDENLALQSDSQDDRHARAMVLAFSPDRSARSEAAEILETMLGDKKSQPAEGNSESRFVLAQLYAGLDDLSKAASHLRSLIASDGSNPRYLTYYVSFLIKRKEISEAALWLPSLQKLAPLEYSTWQVVTEIEFQQERYAEVLSSLDEFVANPAVNEAQRPLNAARSAQLIETFAKRLENAKSSSATDEQSPAWAARFLERADAFFHKYTEELPQDALALAAFLGRHERHSESLDILEKEWDRARPEQVAVVTATLVESTAATQEHHARAEKVLRAALEKHERPLVLVLALADLQNLWERFDDAEELYQEVLEKQPQNPGALNNLALLLALRGRGGQKPMAMIEKAIELVGPDPTLLDTRATISLLLGNPKSAAADLERAIAGRPSAVRFFHQSQVEQRLGKKDAARESLAKANALGLRGVQLHPLERPVYRQLQHDLQ